MCQEGNLTPNLSVDLQGFLCESPRMGRSFLYFQSKRRTMYVRKKEPYANREDDPKLDFGHFSLPEG